MTRQWIIILIAVLTAMPVWAQQQRQSARGDDALNAYKRLDQAKLAERLQALGMKEMIAALKDQTAGSTSLSDMFVTAQCTASLALSEVADLDLREQMMADAIGLMRRCIKSSEKINGEEGYVTLFQHQVALARVLGYDRCALYGDKVLMLIGGAEDRKLLDEYTRDVLMPGKDERGQETKAMVADLLDRMAMKLEDWQPTTYYMTLSPTVEDYRLDLENYRPWMLFYRGLGAADPVVRDDCLDQAIAYAEQFLFTEDGDPDPVMIMLQGIANSELGFLKRTSDKKEEVAESEDHFTQAQDLLKRAQSVRGIADTLKINLEFHQCCNLIRWGKFEDALTRINKLPDFVTNLLGRSSRLAADMRVALLKNYLYDSWSAATKDPAASKQLASQGQDAIMEFIVNHGDDAEAVGDFLKMLASKFRGSDVKTLTPLLQYAVGADQYDRYAELSRVPNASTIEMENVRKKAVEALDLVIASTSPEVKGIQAKAQELRVALGGNWGDVAEMALALGTKDALYNAAVLLKRTLDGGATDAAIRFKLIEVIQTLAKHREFTGKREQELFYDLGEQFRMLSRRSVPDEEMIDFLAAGADAFAKVPPNTPRLAMGSRFMNITLRQTMLLALKESSLSDLVAARKLSPAAMANELIGTIDTFVTDAAATKGDAALAKDLQVWSALSRFNKGVLLWELRNDDNRGKPQAIQIFDALRKEFKDSKDVPVVLMSWEYQIRRAIEEGNTQEAIDGIGQIQKQAPDQATALMGQVITQVQANIAKMRARNSAEDRQKLPKLRETYRDFAKRLLDSAPANQSRVGYEQLYADALLETGAAQEALGYFTKLRDAEEAARKTEADKIDKLIDGKLKELADKTMNEAVKQLGVEFPAFVKKQNLPAASNYEREVASAVTRVSRENQTDEQLTYEFNNLKNALKRGYEAVREQLKGQIPMSLINIQGLARCHHGLKNYTEAMKLYDLLTGNLNRKDYPMEYWRAQLERTQCQFDQALTMPDEDKVRTLRYLVQYINNYRKIGAGELDVTLLGQFGDLEKKIKDAGGL